MAAPQCMKTCSWRCFIWSPICFVDCKYHSSAFGQVRVWNIWV